MTQWDILRIAPSSGCQKKTRSACRGGAAGGAGRGAHVQRCVRSRMPSEAAGPAALPAGRRNVKDRGVRAERQREKACRAPETSHAPRSHWSAQSKQQLDDASHDVAVLRVREDRALSKDHQSLSTSSVAPHQPNSYNL